jgi:hypothetical protein
MHHASLNRSRTHDIAIDGSFCLVRRGSPAGHCVPVTMLTLGPATGVAARAGAMETRNPTTSEAERPHEKECAFIPDLFY